MKHLVIPSRLQTEFATVVAIWCSNAETTRVDALILSWVKYEKQLRRLFAFLVFQHPEISGPAIDTAIQAMVEHRELYPATFIRGIAALGVSPVPKLIGETHAELAKEISRIKKYRNKLMHGQMTGQKIRSPQLENDVLVLIRWITTLGDAADVAFGYDGIGRNTYRRAQTSKHIDTGSYPFNSIAGFKEWLGRLKPSGA